MTTILKGTTVSNDKNGRGLGYPTANISTKTDLKDGVYLGFASLGQFKNRPALIFIGAPITFGKTERRIEAHLLDIPDKDYYSSHLVIEVLEFIRPNKKFGSMQELRKAMKNDELKARNWFKSHTLANQSNTEDTA